MDNGSPRSFGGSRLRSSQQERRPGSTLASRGASTPPGSPGCSDSRAVAVAGTGACSRRPRRLRRPGTTPKARSKPAPQPRLMLRATGTAGRSVTGTIWPRRSSPSRTTHPRFSNPPTAC
jgi:hypothetical protein